MSDNAHDHTQSRYWLALRFYSRCGTDGGDCGGIGREIIQDADFRRVYQRSSASHSIRHRCEVVAVDGRLFILVCKFYASW